MGQGCRKSVLGRWLLATSLAGLGGCVHWFHPIDPPKPEIVQPCRQLSKCSRDRVYVIFVNGLDPLNKNNLQGMCEYLHGLGFRQTYFGQFYHAHWLDSEIRRIHCEDPEARFILVGYSCGAKMAESMARALGRAGVFIDALIYLGGDLLCSDPAERPTSVGRIINVTGDPCLLLGGSWCWSTVTLPDAENIHLDGTGHADLPSHPLVVELITQEVLAVAASIPAPVEPLEPVPAFEEAPTPRPVTPPVLGVRDEWDFLKPVTQLQAPVLPEPPAEPPPPEGPAVEPTP